MESSAINQIKNYGPFKWVLGIIGALLVGALGNGLWELVLRDALVWVGNITLTFMSSIWVGYIDSLHRDIGKLHQDSLILPLFAIATVLVIFGPWVMVANLISRNSRLREEFLGQAGEETLTAERLVAEINALRKKIFWRLIPLVVFNAAFYAVQTWKTTYTRNASNWAERSIEILCPYIPQQEFLMLRSDLRRVDNAERFYDLERRLKGLSEKKLVGLPEFTVIHKD